MKVFSIFDSKVGSFLPPFMMRTVGEVERALSSLVADPQHNFSKYAEDFILFELGSWDEVSGKYSLLSAPHSVCVLMSLRKL